ncbi:MAG: lipase maturation factor family protein, partial [Myxococcota bacterium]
SDGILPASSYLDGVRLRLGAFAYSRIPTLFWLSSTDATLSLGCGLGVALSGALLLGIAPRLVLALLWLLYLSFVPVGQIFLGYQWDYLLLETAFLGIWIAPPVLRSRLTTDPPVGRAALFLGRWLLFRLVLLSGAVKLFSGDPNWWSLRAMDFHYWTQPLPAWTSLFAHFLPPSAHTLSSAATFAVELGVPFLIIGPRRPRLLAAASIVALQVVIGATGNYGFFGLLTVTLCVLLIDDASWRRLLPARITTVPAKPPGPTTLRTVAFGIFATAIVLVTGAQGVRRVLGRDALPDGIQTALAFTAPLRSFNSYGLFAVMTTDRTEITVEGSNDLRTWKPYEFRYKPDRLDEAPRFVQPHMPRLDWQLWFAALHRSCRRDPWFVQFVERLLHGSAPVRSLLAYDPFGDVPPRYIRARLYRYRFSQEPGRWWDREPIGDYCPTLTLRAGRVQRVR